MAFEIIGEITDIETIAAGHEICDLARLRRVYGPGHWRKLKGIVQFVWLVLAKLDECEEVGDAADQEFLLKASPGHVFLSEDSMSLRLSTVQNARSALECGSLLPLYARPACWSCRAHCASPGRGREQARRIKAAARGGGPHSAAPAARKSCVFMGASLISWQRWFCFCLPLDDNRADASLRLAYSSGWLQVERAGRTRCAPFSARFISRR